MDETTDVVVKQSVDTEPGGPTILKTTVVRRVVTEREVETAVYAGEEAVVLARRRDERNVYVLTVGDGSYHWHNAQARPSGLSLVGRPVSSLPFASRDAAVRYAVEHAYEVRVVPSDVELWAAGNIS